MVNPPVGAFNVVVSFPATDQNYHAGAFSSISLFGVNPDTLHEWKRQHPEFSEAYNDAKELQKHFHKCFRQVLQERRSPKFGRPRLWRALAHGDPGPPGVELTRRVAPAGGRDDSS